MRAFEKYFDIFIIATIALSIIGGFAYLSTR